MLQVETNWSLHYFVQSLAQHENLNSMQFILQIMSFYALMIMMINGDGNANNTRSNMLLWNKIRTTSSPTNVSIYTYIGEHCEEAGTI